MTAPALVLLTPGHHRLRPVLKRLHDTLHAQRPDLSLAIVDDDADTLGSAVRSLVHDGASEVVCVPLVAAGVTRDDRLAQSVQHAVDGCEETPISVAEPLGATGGCFAALDRQLSRALAAAGARELDALVLWHDASTAADHATLERRARRWAQHHRLPVRLAALGRPGAIDEAVALHLGQGHHHIGVATLAVHADPQLLAHAARLPGVVGVGRPLGDDPAITEAILARYAVAALEALEMAV